MPEELPIACSLSAPDLETRVAEMAALGRDALIDTSAGATHARLRFRAGGDVRERVAAIVAAESRCCAFLDMRVSDGPEAVVLDVDAPEGAEVVLSELVRAFES